SGELRTRDENGDFIYYDDPADIFANKDPRLWGTVIYPGSTFRGQPVEIQAGVLRWNESTNSYQAITSTTPGTRYTDGGVLVGADGPVDFDNVTHSGFYIRKWLDPRPGSGQRGQGADIWWIRFRYGEILLTAAEAAFELGRTTDALRYINEVRERAGFGPNSLTSLTMDRIQHERRVELAFENH